MNPVALDTSVLLAVVLDETPRGDALRAVFARRALRGTRFLVPVYCVSEFWALATDARAPVCLSPLRALAWLDRLLADGAELLVPGADYWRWLHEVLAANLPTGLSISNCQIAALCRQSGIREIWTFDRTFAAMDGLDAVDPFLLEGDSPGG
jgi:predicted nucleic acid-binding protein